MNSVHNFTLYLFNIHSNIILPPTPWSSEWFFPSGLPPLSSPWIWITLIIFAEAYKLKRGEHIHFAFDVTGTFEK
jgi:hypothetical protein